MAIYALWALLWCGSYFLLIVSYILTLVVSCIFVYRIRAPKILIKIIIVFNVSAALLGSFIYFLYKILARIIPSAIGENTSGAKVIVFTALAGISGICVYFGNLLMSGSKVERVVEVQVTIQKREYTLHLLADSGNVITDPISGKKVIIISSRCARKIFGRHLDEIDYMSTRRRWICVHSVTGTKALQAFLPENIVQNKTLITALIAVSQEEDFEGYDGLYPVSLIT